MMDGEGDGTHDECEMFTKPKLTRIKWREDDIPTQHSPHGWLPESTVLSIQSLVDVRRL